MEPTWKKIKFDKNDRSCGRSQRRVRSSIQNVSLPCFTSCTVLCSINTDGTYFFLKFMGTKTKIPVDQKRNTNMYKTQICTIWTTRLKVIGFSYISSGFKCWIVIDQHIKSRVRIHAKGQHVQSDEAVVYFWNVFERSDEVINWN